MSLSVKMVVTIEESIHANMPKNIAAGPCLFGSIFTTVSGSNHYMSLYLIHFRSLMKATVMALSVEVFFYLHLTGTRSV